MAHNYNLVQGLSLEEVRPDDVEYAWIRAKMHNSICAHNGNLISTYEICKVSRVYNFWLWNAYTYRRSVMQAEMGGQHVEEVRLFHGTGDAEAIIRNGFDLRYAHPNGMFGGGIYFSDVSSKSNQYTSSADPLCSCCVRQMLICRVALGYRFRTTHPINYLPQEYHSIEAVPSLGGLRYPEYIIYNNYQAYPGFLVNYRIKQVVSAGCHYCCVQPYY